MLSMISFHILIKPIIILILQIKKEAMMWRDFSKVTDGHNSETVKQDE